METPTAKDYIELLNNTNRLYVLLGVGITLIVLSIFYPFFVPFAFLVSFCFLDVVGFKTFSESADELYYHGYVLNNDAKILAKRMIPAYRILQATIQVSLLLVITLHFGLIYAMAAEILHWFAVQDLLYYWTVNVPLPKTWTWLHWTPFGILDGNLTNGQVITMSVLGLLISIVLLIIKYINDK